MSLRYEAWTLPWSGDFHRVIAKIPVVVGTGSGTLRFREVAGDGRMDVALGEDFDRLDEIISTTAGTLIRVFDGITVLHEWVAQKVDRSHDSETRTVTVSGPSLQAMLDRWIVYPFDYPKQPSLDPDWLFGDLDNLLRNPGGENVPLPNGGLEDRTLAHWSDSDAETGLGNSNIALVNDPGNAFEGDHYLLCTVSAIRTGVVRSITGLTVGATYTFTVRVKESTGAGDRMRIGYLDASNATHTNAYFGDELWWAEIGNAAEGLGSTDGTWQLTTLTFVATEESGRIVIITEEATPAIDFWVDAATLSGKSSGLDPWYAMFPSRTNTFEYSTAQADAGVGSIVWQGNDKLYTNPYTGRQAFGTIGVGQETRLEIGKTYRASMRIYHESGGNETYILIIQRRTILGQPGTPGSSYMWSEKVVVPTATWTTVDFEFVADTEDVVFQLRWQYQGAFDTSLHASPTTYMDSMVLSQGLAAGTIGEISTTIFDDAAVDHADDPRGTPLDWVDYSSWTDLLDSSAIAWTDSEVSMSIPFGFGYGHYLDDVTEFGYEWDLVPKAGPITPGDPTHDLEIYNRGNRDDAPSTAINVGQGIVEGSVVRRIPAFTRVVVEGLAGAWIEDEDATAVANFGALERFEAAREIGDLASLGLISDEFLNREVDNRTAVQVRVVATLDHPRPGVDYRPGDTVPFQLPPDLPKADRRVQRIDYTNTFPTSYVVTGSIVLTDEAGAWDLVRRLWRAFLRRNEKGSAGFASAGGQGGVPRIVIAAFDASDRSKAKADLVALTADADLELSVAIAEWDSGEIRFTEGGFEFTEDRTIPAGCWLTGAGIGATGFTYTGDPTWTWSLNSGMRDIGTIAGGG